LPLENSRPTKTAAMKYSLTVQTESHQRKPQTETEVTPVTAVTITDILKPARRKSIFTPKSKSAYPVTTPASTETLTLPLFYALPRLESRPPAAQLTHTPDHLHCPACIQADAELRGVNQDLAAMTFPDAAQYWMRLRDQAELKERSKDGTRAHLEALNKFFGGMQLTDILPGHLKAYQICRQKNEMNGAPLWSRPAAADRINHELGCLGQMMKQARLWARLRPFYFPLHIAKWSARTVLSETEEAKLWKKAAKSPAAALAYYVATLTNHTSAAGCELRGLRLKDVTLEDEIAEINVTEVKNTSRQRKIPLNPSARWATGQLMKRALKLGCCQPEHFLFPFNLAPHTYDPTRPASPWFLRKSWDALRKASGFRDLRPHDLRHHCITRMLEQGVEPETVRAIAGHVTVQMMDFYSHQRTRVKYAAVLKIEQGREPKPPAPPVSPE
jgi:integrase